MGTYRYSARIKTTLTAPDGIETPAEKTTTYDYLLKSESDGLIGLKDFLDARKREYVGRLMWVALERTEANTTYNDPHAEWQEVTRLRALSGHVNEAGLGGIGPVP